MLHLRAFVASLAAALLLAAPAWPQARPPVRAGEEQLGQLDSSEALFTVMAALVAGGYNTEADSPTNHPLRKALRDHFNALSLKSVDALKRYVRDHKPKNPALELNQYVSYALLIKGPPTFGWKEPNLPPPPDVAAIDDLPPLIVDFYQEAKIGELWTQVQPYYDREIERYHEPVSRAVLQANAYLRNPTDGTKGRHFQVLIDLLGPPNEVQTRHYLDDDIVVVTPAVELPIDEIRHAYLRYLIDPLSFKYSKELRNKSALKDYALGSPILEQHYKDDFGLLATECLIRAIESRLDRNPAEVDLALREGFVLTPAFAELLMKYEAQDQAMKLYFPDLVNGIDLRKEEKRLDHVDFLSARPEKTYRVTKTAEDKPALSGAAKTLDDAEQLYLDRKLPKAKETFLQALQQTTVKPLQAKAYYGLGRIAALERDPETADKMFRQVLDLEPDPSTRSWSLLYLGRLADAQGDRDQAQEFYKSALAVPGVPDPVKQAAENGVKQAFSK